MQLRTELPLFFRLSPGDIVDIVAPSSRSTEEVLPKITAFLEAWGLRCHMPEDLLGNNLLYANSDEKRFEHLENALNNSTSKAVWCLRGGFGAVKLLPMLHELKKPKAQKLLMGFSDTTALHVFLENQWGWSTLHAPTAQQIALNQVSDESVVRLKSLLLKNDALHYDHLTPLNQPAETLKKITGKITGGNMHLIQATLGTPWQIQVQGKILYLEEVGERAYRVDRILAHLDYAGILKQAKAIIFGDMVDPGEPNGQFLVNEVVKAFAQTCSIPVLQLANTGHANHNWPVVFGSEVTIER